MYRFVRYRTVTAVTKEEKMLYYHFYSQFEAVVGALYIRPKAKSDPVPGETVALLHAHR